MNKVLYLLIVAVLLFPAMFVIANPTYDFQDVRNQDEGIDYYSLFDSDRIGVPLERPISYSLMDYSPTYYNWFDITSEYTSFPTLGDPVANGSSSIDSGEIPLIPLDSSIRQENIYDMFSVDNSQAKSTFILYHDNVSVYSALVSNSLFATTLDYHIDSSLATPSPFVLEFLVIRGSGTSSDHILYADCRADFADVDFSHPTKAVYYHREVIAPNTALYRVWMPSISSDDTLTIRYGETIPDTIADRAMTHLSPTMDAVADDSWDMSSPYSQTYAPAISMPSRIAYPGTVRTVAASGADFTTVAAAISAASPGDVIDIWDAQTTTVTITVDKSLSFVSSTGLGSIERTSGTSGDYILSLTAGTNVQFDGVDVKSSVTRGMVAVGTLFWDSGDITITSYPDLILAGGSATRAVFTGGTHTGYLLPQAGALWVMGGSFVSSSPVRVSYGNVVIDGADYLASNPTIIQQGIGATAHIYSYTSTSTAQSATVGVGSAFIHPEVQGYGTLTLNGDNYTLVPADSLISADGVPSYLYPNSEFPAVPEPPAPYDYTNPTLGRNIIVDALGGGDYTTLADAVANASNGDVVEIVGEQTYNSISHITINNIKLMNGTINTDRSWYVTDVVFDNVTINSNISDINSYIIRTYGNCRIENCNLISQSRGIANFDELIVINTSVTAVYVSGMYLGTDSVLWLDNYAGSIRAYSDSKVIISNGEDTIINTASNSGTEYHILNGFLKQVMEINGIFFLYPEADVIDYPGTVYVATAPGDAVGSGVAGDGTSFLTAHNQHLNITRTIGQDVYVWTGSNLYKNPANLTRETTDGVNLFWEVGAISNDVDIYHVFTATGLSSAQESAIATELAVALGSAEGSSNLQPGSEFSFQIIENIRITDYHPDLWILYHGFPMSVSDINNVRTSEQLQIITYTNGGFQCYEGGELIITYNLSSGDRAFVDTMTGFYTLGFNAGLGGDLTEFAICVVTPADPLEQLFRWKDAEVYDKRVVQYYTPSYFTAYVRGYGSHANAQIVSGVSDYIMYTQNVVLSYTTYDDLVRLYEGATATTMVNWNEWASVDYDDEYYSVLSGWSYLIDYLDFVYPRPKLFTYMSLGEPQTASFYAEDAFIDPKVGSLYYNATTYASYVSAGSISVIGGTAYSHLYYTKNAVLYTGAANVDQPFTGELVGVYTLSGHTFYYNSGNASYVSSNGGYSQGTITNALLTQLIPYTSRYVWFDADNFMVATPEGVLTRAAALPHVEIPGFSESFAIVFESNYRYVSLEYGGALFFNFGHAITLVHDGTMTQYYFTDAVSVNTIRVVTTGNDTGWYINEIVYLPAVFNASDTMRISCIAPFDYTMYDVSDTEFFDTSYLKLSGSLSSEAVSIFQTSDFSALYLVVGEFSSGMFTVTVGDVQLECRRDGLNYRFIVDGHEIFIRTSNQAFVVSLVRTYEQYVLEVTQVRIVGTSYEQLAPSSILSWVDTDEAVASSVVVAYTSAEARIYDILVQTASQSVSLPDRIMTDQSNTVTGDGLSMDIRFWDVGTSITLGDWVITRASTHNLAVTYTPDNVTRTVAYRDAFSVLWDDGLRVNDVMLFTNTSIPATMDVSGYLRYSEANGIDVTVTSEKVLTAGDLSFDLQEYALYVLILALLTASAVAYISRRYGFGWMDLIEFYGASLFLILGAMAILGVA